MNMKVVRVIADYTWPEMLRQTPGCRGIWNNIKFTFESVKNVDYAIFLNPLGQKITLKCPKEHIWSIIQEPSSTYTKFWHKNPRYSFKTYNQDTDLYGPEQVLSQPALPWHINKDFDYLTSLKVPEKLKTLSTITSMKRKRQGQIARLDFLDRLKTTLDFDLIATFEYYLRNKHVTKEIKDQLEQELSRSGFVCVEDKWEGLFPYKYSIAMENFSNPYYWTEKIIDCYLAWTMPVYYGCTKITQYFPEESMIIIDINSPSAIDIIKSAISDKKWEHNIDAIKYARELILNKYQLFPFITNQINQFESCNGVNFKKHDIVIEPENSAKQNKIRAFLSKIKQIIR